MFSVTSLLAAGAVGLVILYLVSRRTPVSSLPLPPGPPALPIIGNVHQAPKSHAWLQFAEWGKQYGPVMHLNMLGQHVIVLSTSRAAHDLLAKRGATFSDRPKMFVAQELALKNMNTLLMDYHERFHMHQKLEGTVLNPNASAKYREFQSLESKQLLFDILKTADGLGSDLRGHIERTVVSTIFALFYGFRIQDDKAPELQDALSLDEEFSEFVQVGAFLVDSFPILNILPAPLAPWKAKAEAHYQRQRSLHMTNLKRGLKEPGWTFTKQLYTTVQEEDIDMPFEELAFEFGTMVDAALDGTVETMMWFFIACITQGNGFITKAQNELDRVVGRDRLPSFDDRPSLPYISAILEEVLRWRPAGAGGVPHFTKVESTYNKHRIPAGSVVIANAWAISREEAVFGPDTEDFVPDRWLGPGVELKTLPVAGFGILWAFNIKAGLSENGDPTTVDAVNSTDGLVMRSLPFKASLKPRDEKARQIIESECYTHDVDLGPMLAQIGVDLPQNNILEGLFKTQMEGYIDNLLAEINRLRHAVNEASASPSRPCTDPETEPSLLATPATPPVDTSFDATGATPTSTVRPGDAVQNPLMGDRPWFMTLTPEMPILIGEATDVAFATRFRQEMMGDLQDHFPRTQNINDTVLLCLWNANNLWPTPPRARFLTRVVFNTACRRYYLVRKSVTLQLLEQAMIDPTTCDLLSTCKLYAIFALGELYSTRTCRSEDEFPGIKYYVAASKMLRILSEQSAIDCVEIMVMLSVYSLAMNRRHYGYCIAGCAMRFSIITGLHLNVPRHQLPNRELQEHRIRLWWSSYMLDRSWACMLGKPVSIQDEDIEANLPSTLDLSRESVLEDFADTDYFIASLRIANLGAQITSSIYSRKEQRQPLSYRVQRALRDLGNWLQQLPEPLRSTIDCIPPNAAMPIITLYLYFNHCLILASRPVLLYTLRLRRVSIQTEGASMIPLATDNALSLSEACLQSARRSYRILAESWISGLFPTFDYTYPQYLFSAAIVLAISSVLPSPDHQSDGDDFEAAAGILSQLEQNGNLPAKEFCRHIDAIKVILVRASAEENQTDDGHDAGQSSSAHNWTQRSAQEIRSTTCGPEDDARLALSETSLQDLLSQSNLDLLFLEESIIDNNFEAFRWPEGDGGV
ncbi:fungal-specific transcription factor domain-containing protein [Paramyrothecium foliicola]|nr:fungal-specific transcription factor domain-containing protein [Paramyrothecium foliicola]